MAVSGKTFVRIFGGTVLVALLFLLGIFVTGHLLPEQHSVSVSMGFDRTPEELWALIADFEGSAEWRPGVESVERLPDEAGRPIYEESGRFGALRYAVEEQSPPRRLVTRITQNSDFGGTWTYVIEPEGDGSRITITENGEIYNPVFRVLTRYVFGYEVTLRDYLDALRVAAEAST